MQTAGNTPRNAAPLPCRPISAAALTTAMSSTASCTADPARVSHIAAMVAPQNTMRATAAPSAAPWPPGAGRAWNEVVTTNAIAATASRRIAKVGRPFAAPRPCQLGRAGRGGGLGAHRSTVRPDPAAVSCPAGGFAAGEPPPAGGGPPPTVGFRRRARFHRRAEDGTADPQQAGRQDHQHRRSEMSSIGEERGAGRAGTASAAAEPVVSVRGLVKRYGSHEAVRGHRPGGAARGDLRLPRPQRRRQDHDRGDPRRLPASAPTARSACSGHDPATAGGAWRDRVGVVLQESEPEPGLSVRECLALYAGYYRAPRDIDETIALVGLTGAGRHARHPAVGRPAAAARRRARAHRRPRAHLPRRADHRLRPLRPPGRLGGHRRAAQARQDDLPHHPLHGRGGVPGRPDRGAVGRAHRGRAAPRGRSAGATTWPPPSASPSRTACAARDLPDGLRPLAEAGPDGSTVLRSESPLVHLQMLGNWALGRGFDLPDLDVHRPTLEEVYLSLTGSTSTKDHR